MTITAQAEYSQSEQPIVQEGVQARRDGRAITDNPYPAVCQQSQRDHWLWDQGFYMQDKHMKEQTA